MGIGWTEIVVILIVALLLFGRRLPEVARSMGKSVGEFKKGLKESQDELNNVIKVEPPKDASEKK